jgi:UDP-N-acetylmuramoyl-tripeptide--D-alanyl-D-alanine ligase
MHREVGQFAGKCGANRFITVGELSKETAAGIRETAPGAEVREFATVDDLMGLLGELIRPGDSVLIKASHSMQFDRISKALKERDNACN